MAGPFGISNVSLAPHKGMVTSRAKYRGRRPEGMVKPSHRPHGLSADSIESVAPLKGEVVRDPSLTPRGGNGDHSTPPCGGYVSVTPELFVT